jgi:uncharacterized protein YjbI with pentapeptide repeats
MSNPEHLEILKLGSSVWNRWRAENPHIVPDLSRAHLREGRLSGANLTGADLRLAYFGRADLSGSNLSRADLSETSLRRGYFAKAILENTRLIGADLRHADFYGARLVGANLSRAYLEGANLTGADLERANLASSDLRLAVAVDANFRRADLTGCQVYGVSAWNVILDGADQRDLIITPPQENVVTTDSLHVAQFLYLLLNNRTIRDVIETVGKKAVLLLGRFDNQRKPVLEAIRNELRRAGLVPILFDFEGPSNRDITETVSILAHLARAVIADLTEARSVPQELITIIPNLPSVPLQPIIASSAVEYGMFEHFRKYPWVRETFCYTDSSDLLDWLRANLNQIAGL